MGLEARVIWTLFIEDGGEMEERQVSRSEYGNSRKTPPGILSVCRGLVPRTPRTAHFVCMLVPLTSVDSDQNPK